MINFIYKWGGVREQCWSGTPYGIEEALKRIASVNDVPLSPEKNRISARLRRWKEKIIYGSCFSIIDTLNGIKEINALPLKKGDPGIVFLEYDSKYAPDTYSYQDLTVDFIVRLGKEHPELAIFSPLPKNVSEPAIRKRLELTRQFYGNCRGLFTMSKWLAKDIIDNTGIEEGKVHWVGGGCNIDVSKIEYSHKEGTRFLFVGKDWIRKNGALVVDAFLKLRKIYPNIELYIAGSAHNPVKVKEDTAGIKYLGRLSYEQLAFYYNLCDYFVMPSQFEAYGIVFAEALSFGLPCIGKNCFAMPEFIKDGENGYLLQENDAEELMEKMKLLLEDASIRDNVIRHKDYYIQEYSWSAVARRIVEVMRNDGYFLE